MKANILTIGTEITGGEIVNSNAAWIAQRLVERGYDVIAHLTVPDERSAMLSALRKLPSARVLIVTGGLGPTSDDITREVLAKWLGKKLLFSDSVWRDLAKLYKKRKLPLREAHRHQCYFPKGTTILNNPVGTAHGFTAKKAKCQIFVLPGPPRELEGMWNEGVEPALVDGGELPWHHWTCLGVPESEVAEKVEPLIDGLGLEVGYRASIPYVYLKLRGKKFSPKLSLAVESALGAGIVGKAKHDFVEDLLEALQGQEVVFQDQVTRGFLSARLSTFFRQMPESKFRIEECWNLPLNPGSSKVTCGQILLSDDENGFDLTWRDDKRMHRHHFALPFRYDVRSERGAKAAAEFALFHWWNWVKASS
jgi:nicotinamide-nucleotide amidase